MYDVETGLYYLRSRFYKPENGRFLNADKKYDCNNLFEYSNSSPVNYLDANGTTSVELLNRMYHNYLVHNNTQILFDQLLRSNPNNLYLAFHETAQIVAAADLTYSDYSDIFLEEAIISDGTHYESDIACHKTDGSVYIYEIKPYGTSGIPQINRYTKGENYYPGNEYIPTLRFQVNDKYDMEIFSSTKTNAVIHYAFYNRSSNQREANVNVLKSLLLLLESTALMWFLGNDATGVGVADDFLIGPLMYLMSR